MDGNADDSVETTLCTLSNGALFVAAKFRQALSLNGNDYLDCGNPSQYDFGTGSWTVSVLVKAASSSEVMIVFSNEEDDSGGIHYVVSMGPASVIYCPLRAPERISPAWVRSQEDDRRQKNFAPVIGLDYKVSIRYITLSVQ